MKKYLLIAGLLVSSFAVLSKENSHTPSHYAVALHFNSICCGAPDDGFLKQFLQQFNSANKVTVKGYIASACGKEGEYKILLSGEGLNADIQAKLKTELDSLIPKQNAANKAANANSGFIELQHNPVADQWPECRNPIADWKY